MARYQYTGPGPLEVQDLLGNVVDLIRPGDVREFDAEPHYGPWECIDPPPEPAPEAPAVPPAAPFAAPPLTPKDM